jgi:hypothetical protein
MVKSAFRTTIVCAAFGAAAALGGNIGGAAKAAVPKPVVDKQEHFSPGTWSSVPQAGPDGKVRQCVLVAPRNRAGPGGGIETRFSIDISSGAGLVFSLGDDQLPVGDILDDEAEIILDGHAFPAVAFTITNSNNLAIHPGDAAGVLAGLAKAATIRIHSAGDGLDTGPVALDLPVDALAWLKLCGQTFNIPVDRPSDPNTPPLPAPRPPSPEIGSNQPTPAGPPGIEDKQKIAGWDASELRGSDGRVLVCFIRAHYALSQDSIPSVHPRFLGTFLIVSRAKGLTMMFKDSMLNLPGGQPVQASLTIEKKPFTGFDAHVLGNDEIGLFPEHGAALAVALGDGSAIAFKSPVEGFEFFVPGGVVPWLRACGRRWGIPFEPEAKN